MTTSTDGITWSLVQRIPTDPVGSGADHFIPGIGVDKTTGGAHARLALTYYYYPNANCTDATCQLDVGYISSTNGGQSWSQKQKLAGPMRVTWLANTTQGYMVGDYISTSIPTGTNNVAPAFELAAPPTGTQFREATFTDGGNITAITGGDQPTDTTAPALPPNAAAAPAPLPLLSR